MDTIGLVLAGGDVLRMSRTPKFFLPVQGTFLLSWICSKMMDAGFKEVIIVTKQIWEAPIRLALKEAKVVVGDYPSPMAAVQDFAREELKARPEARYVMAMCDVYTTDFAAFGAAARLLETGKPSVSTVAFSKLADDATGYGVLTLKDSNEVVKVVDKPNRAELSSHQVYPIWGVLGWNSAFGEILAAADSFPTGTLSDIVSVALSNSVKVKCYYSWGAYYDCGTNGRYFRMIRDEVF